MSGTTKTPHLCLPPTHFFQAYYQSQLQRCSSYPWRSAYSYSKRNYLHCMLANRNGVPAPECRRLVIRNQLLRHLWHLTHLRQHLPLCQGSPKPLQLKGTLTTHHNHQSTPSLKRKMLPTACQQQTMLLQNQNLLHQRSLMVPTKPPSQYMTQRWNLTFICA